MPKKSKSLAKLKKEADRVFSIWVRSKDADSNGFISCVCCGATKPWKEMHAGHWHSRYFTSVRWSEINAAPCCYRCNVLLKGNYPEYAKWFYKTYSAEQIESLDLLKRQSPKLTRSDLEEIVEKYRNAV